MRSILLSLLTVSLSLSLFSQDLPGKRYKPIVLDPSYNHTKWGVEPEDKRYDFAAFSLSFDTDDDNDGDGDADIWGIPEWVAYEVKKEEDDGPGRYNRPKWMTDSALHRMGIAPDDDTYAVSGTRSMSEVKTDYRYVRGHMCPKDAADRIGMEAGYNTHTVLNAVPQLQWQNNGIWKDLEEMVTDWADEYDQVWVVCGPVFFKKSPAVWLGQDGEVKAAVPDALFKVVMRESDSGLETLSFIIPNVIPKEEEDISEFLTSMGRVEELTGLSFLGVLSESEQEEIKARHDDISDGEKMDAVGGW